MSDSTNSITKQDAPAELPPEAPPKVYTRGEILVRRVLFYLGIGFWVLVLMIPFTFVVLAMRGEVSVNLPGDYPDSRLRVWMVMEPRERGIGYSLPRVVERDDDIALTVQTNVRLMMWEGESEALAYCNVFTRPDAESDWTSEAATEGEC